MESHEFRPMGLECSLRYDKGMGAWVFDCRGRAQRSDEYLIAQAAGCEARYQGQGFKRQFVCWYTRNARVALRLAGYCADDQERARILAEARDEKDPDRVTITFDGADFRWWAPVRDPAHYRASPKFAEWEFDPGNGLSHQAYWFTQAPIQAVLCVRHAIEELGAGILDIRVEALTMLNDYLSEWQSPPLDYTQRQAELALPDKTTEAPETLKVRTRS